MLQELSNLLVVEDKVEEEITDVESELEVLHKQVRGQLRLVATYTGQFLFKTVKKGS